MGPIRLATAAAVVLVMAGMRPGGAASTYPWCTTGAGMEFGARNCGFTTFEQCMATARGSGQMCERNPFANEPQPAPQPQPKRRKSG